MGQSFVEYAGQNKIALTGELLEKWAEADANGIAEGYELMKKEGD